MAEKIQNNNFDLTQSSWNDLTKYLPTNNVVDTFVRKLLDYGKFVILGDIIEKDEYIIKLNDYIYYIGKSGSYCKAIKSVNVKLNIDIAPYLRKFREYPTGETQEEEGITQIYSGIKIDFLLYKDLISLKEKRISEILKKFSEENDRVNLPFISNILKS